VIPEASYASSGAVLIVDDEPDIRKLVGLILTSAGYTVFTADSGDQAIRTFKKHGNEITLLLTDVVAPGMSGPMLADQLLESQPHLKILFMSGYDASQVVKRYVIERGFTLVPKPFTAEQLVEAVRSAIGPPQAMHGH
jgi:two-component system cell cycle sensor histidine kinase/response regulator CckA